MRDVARDFLENGRDPNTVDRLDLSDEGEATPAREPVIRVVTETRERPEASVRQLREARADRALGHMAVLLLDVSKAIQPVVSVFSGRVFLFCALGASVWLARFVMSSPSPERIAGLAVFMILSTAMLRYGNR